MTPTTPRSCATHQPKQARAQTTNPRFQVVVGNVGTTYSGNLLKAALATYKEYKSQSATNYGRAAGEQVTLFKDGEPLCDYVGTLQPQN